MLKLNNINKGKYIVQIDTLDKFLNFLKCDEILKNNNDSSIGCKKNSKLVYLIYHNKKDFENMCISLKGHLNDEKAPNKWIDYTSCTIDSEVVLATKTRNLEMQKDIYIVSFSSFSAMSENEPLLKYFIQTVLNSSDDKLVINF